MFDGFLLFLALLRVEYLTEIFCTFRLIVGDITLLVGTQCYSVLHRTADLGAAYWW